MEKTVFKLFAAFFGTFAVACTSADPFRTLTQRNSIPDIIERNILDALNAGTPISERGFLPPDSTSKAFVHGTAIYNLFLIQASLLAKERSGRSEINGLADTITSNSSKISSALRTLIAGKRMYLAEYLPLENQQDIARLSRLRGIAFDKAYLDLTEDYFKKEIALFKKTSQKSQDNDIRQFASLRIPDLQAALKSAESIKQKVKSHLRK